MAYEESEASGRNKAGWPRLFAIQGNTTMFTDFGQSFEENFASIDNHSTVADPY